MNPQFGRMAVALPWLLPQHPDNLTNLPQDFISGGSIPHPEETRQPAAFGVAYKVFDSLGDVVRVIKLVTKDRRSVLRTAAPGIQDTDQFARPSHTW